MTSCSVSAAPRARGVRPTAAARSAARSATSTTPSLLVLGDDGVQEQRGGAAEELRGDAVGDRRAVRPGVVVAGDEPPEPAAVDQRHRHRRDDAHVGQVLQVHRRDAAQHGAGEVQRPSGQRVRRRAPAAPARSRRPGSAASSWSCTARGPGRGCRWRGTTARGRARGRRGGPRRSPRRSTPGRSGRPSRGRSRSRCGRRGPGSRPAARAFRTTTAAAARSAAGGATRHPPARPRAPAPTRSAAARRRGARPGRPPRRPPSCAAGSPRPGHRPAPPAAGSGRRRPAPRRASPPARRRAPRRWPRRRRRPGRAR